MTLSPSGQQHFQHFPSKPGLRRSMAKAGHWLPAGARAWLDGQAQSWWQKARLPFRIRSSSTLQEFTYYAWPPERPTRVFPPSNMSGARCPIQESARSSRCDPCALDGASSPHSPMQHLLLFRPRVQSRRRPLPGYHLPLVVEFFGGLRLRRPGGRAHFQHIGPAGRVRRAPQASGSGRTRGDSRRERGPGGEPELDTLPVPLPQAPPLSLRCSVAGASSHPSRKPLDYSSALPFAAQVATYKELTPWLKNGPALDVVRTSRLAFFFRCPT